MPFSQKASVPAPQESSHKWIPRVIEGVILFLALILGLTIRLAVFETAIVISRSMQTTLEVGDRVLVDHRSTLKGEWQRGDVLLFDPPEDWGDGDSLTKRLIALPGETIRIDAFEIYINGHLLHEPYIHQKDGNWNQTIHLGPSQYWVMGDNRDNSEDSRALGPISEENIRGRGLWRIYPLTRIGRLTRPTYGF